MGCCCLPPDRVKLAVNSKKETNRSVKLGKGSRWASVDSFLLFQGVNNRNPPWPILTLLFFSFLLFTVSLTLSGGK